MDRLNIFVLGIRGFPDIQGGAEKHCEGLYPRLAGLGYEVTVVTRTPYITKEKQVSEYNGVKFLHLWAPKQKSLEAVVHTFLGAIVCMVKRPDIVHIHNIGPALVIAFLKLSKISTVLTYHSVNYRHQKWGKIAKFILRLGEFLGLKFADKVIVISRTTKEFLEKEYGRRDLEFIPNGVNLPEAVSGMNILKEYGLEPRKYIFTACRFAPEKGLHDLIAAYQRIENPVFKLVIAGDADFETKYDRNLKKSAEGSGKIVLTGLVSGKILQQLYSNAGLFVLPSYHEGLPIALLEAMSHGLPVLVSDIPANKQVPLPDFRFFPMGDVRILSQKIAELFSCGISQEEVRTQKELVVKNYNWDKIAKKTDQVYKELIGSSPVSFCLLRNR